VTSRRLTFTVAIVAVAAAVPSTVVSSQSALDAAANREKQLVATIEREQAASGVFAEELIAPLTELALLYQESADRGLASVTIERVLQVVRANYGLYSLAQAPPIGQLIANEESAGNYETAWTLEDELLTLARRHPEDLRTVPIFREIADSRMKRIGTPELPLRLVCRGWELKRGCNGDAIDYGPTWVRTLVLQGAMNDWGDAVNVLIDNRLYDSPVLRELEQKLIDFGSCDVARESYRRLEFYDTATSASWLDRATTIVRAADSELVCAQASQPDLKRAALARYREAYELLERNGVAQASIDELFSPATPLTLSEGLPAMAYPMVGVHTTTIWPKAPAFSSGRIDIAFEITKYGRSRKIDIVDATANTTDEEKRRLLRYVRDSLYRPRAANGAIADGSIVVWRYYW
jgi:hypothetical protein